jgi:hypothetical protein
MLLISARCTIFSDIQELNAEKVRNARRSLAPIGSEDALVLADGNHRPTLILSQPDNSTPKRS